MDETTIAVLAESVKGLNARFDDFVSYTERINEAREKMQEETLTQVKKINGSVASLSLRVHDIEFIQSNCPAAELRRDIEESRDQMRFWIFLGKYWKTIAVFIGIIIGVYSAITTIANNINENKIERVIEEVTPSGSSQTESEASYAL